MEHKIGEIFEYNGEWYQCVEGNDCANCVFIDYCKSHSKEERDSAIGLCVSFDRNDGMHVIFEKLEKVGEPYEFDGHLFQSYRTFEVPIFTENYATVRELGNNSKISIEIKQNKEDMEENNAKHSNSESIGRNLKPFDLEAARSGKPVCTRDGRKARIVCFDAKGDKPIISLVEAKGNKDALIEEVERYFINGHPVFEVRETNNDLMMLPEKKEGWVNIYYDGGTYYSKYIYKTEKEATGQADTISPNHVATVKIEWEE